VKTIQLAYGKRVVLLRCHLVPEIMQGRAPKFFLHQYSWKVAISPILHYRDLKTKKKSNINHTNNIIV
jgi:hypothetical protein